MVTGNINLAVQLGVVAVVQGHSRYAMGKRVGSGSLNRVTSYALRPEEVLRINRPFLVGSFPHFGGDRKIAKNKFRFGLIHTSLVPDFRSFGV